MIDERCPHHKAFFELLQFSGRELSLAQGDAILEWAMNICVIRTTLDDMAGIYCLAWEDLVDSISLSSNDPTLTRTYNQMKHKMDELQQRVAQEELEDAKTN